MQSWALQRCVHHTSASPITFWCSVQSILRGNVLDFVAYGFYCSTFERLDPQRRAATLAFVAEAEQLWGVRWAL